MTRVLSGIEGDQLAVRRRRRLFRVAVVVGAIVLSLVLGEILLRVIGYGNPVRYVSSETLLWKLAPSQLARIPGTPFRVRINAAGFRGPERETAKPSDVLRVLALGDSVTFGIQVDEGDTYPAKLEEALSAMRPERRAEVWNAGVPGYTIEQEVRVLEEAGLALAPDVVTLAFCGNDWLPPLDFEDRRVADTVRRSRWRRIALADFARRAAGLVMTRRKAEIGADGDFESRVIDVGNPRDRGIVAHVEGEIARAAARCAGAGARFAIVLLPEKSQVVSDAPDDTLQSLLGAIAARAGVPCLDLLPAFRGSGAEPSALFASGGDRLHLSIEGNRLVADEIARFLSASGLLPARDESGTASPIPK